MLYIDVGARGGMNELAPLHIELDAIGFEPEPAAYQILASQSASSKLKSSVIEQLALGSAEGEITLHISQRPSMSSVLPFDPLVFDKHFNKIKDAASWKKGLSSIQKKNVQVTTLDNYSGKKQISFIDYLKLDVQGYEMEVLKGTSSLLKNKRIGIIKTEVSFIPVYTGQAVFSEQDHWLRNHGYEMVQLTFDLDWHNKSPVKRSYEKAKMYSGGDAFYMLKDISHLSNAQQLDMAKILCTLGLLSPAKIILTQHIKLSEEKIDEFIANYHHPKDGWKEWVRFLIPPVLLALLKKLRANS